MAKKKINFMCTAFRDGFQSVYGARVLTPDFMPAVEAAKAAGINYFESGGGARFQSLYFYCKEDAFDMMDSFRKAAGDDANLQTLARGVNVVGLDSQPSDIIDLHAKLFKKHGTTTIRNFDALNDVNNLIYSGKAIVNAGLKHQVSITMMELPPGTVGAHDTQFYINTLKSIMDADLPFDSICFKDASGTATPSKIYDTIKAAREMLPSEAIIHFHTHETAGTSVLAYKAALDAGADQIDLSLAPVSGGTSQPDVVTMWHALRGSDYDLDIDIDKILEAEEVLKECLSDYFMPPEALAVEPTIPWSPMPGGALTANTQMLRDNGIMDKYPEIISNMGEVVKKGGFGTSVTPVSQFYFQQAFNNTMFGPWKKIVDGYGRMVLGYFGKTPTEPDAEIVKIAAEQLGLEPTTDTVLDINDRDDKKGVAAAKAMLEAENLETTDENIFIASTCLEKGIAFLKGDGEFNVRKISDTPVASGSGEYTVSVNGKSYGVKLSGDNAVVNGKKYDTEISSGITAPKSAATSSGDGVEIKAPMPGKVFKVIAEEGDDVEDGDTIIVLEAMKMENDVLTHISGKVLSILVEVGDQVNTDDVIATIK
jgi:pyruvate carboxylase subunit B